MKVFIKTLALGLAIAMLVGTGIVAFAEEDVTVSAPEISVERDTPKAEAAPKAEEPKVEELKAEEPKAEEPKAEEPKADAAPAAEEPANAPSEPQSSESNEIGSEMVAEVEHIAEHADESAPAAQNMQPDGQELTTIEDEQTPLAVRPSTPMDGTVRIFASSECPTFGERVQLGCELKGFRGDYALLFQWQVNKGDGWQNISGANARTFDFTYSERVQNFRWRLVVSIDE